MSLTPSRTFGLIGKSLSHSFSAEYFTKKFELEKISARYENFELEKASLIPSILSSGISGCNVTIPYKEEVIPFLVELSSEAKTIGAVNCVVFRDGKSIGHNTDAYGFKESLRPVLRNTHQKALILGTGGASKAVAYVLKELGLEFRFVSRTPVGNQLAYEELNDKAMAYFPFIINTTPIGTAPNVNQAPDIPYPYLNASNLLYDLIYNPAESLFLKKGKAQGALTMNGHKMLLYQAERSWELWNADYLK
jgi:shikimate dehydrogenase